MLKPPFRVVTADSIEASTESELAATPNDRLHLDMNGNGTIKGIDQSHSVDSIIASPAASANGDAEDRLIELADLLIVRN